MTLASPWPLPLAFTSWAFNKTNGQPVDRDAVHNISRLADRMAALTVAVQLTEGITATEVASLRSNGFKVVAWCECDNDTGHLLDQLGPFDGLMPQIEGDGQYDAAVHTLREREFDGLPKAVVSDYGGLESKQRCDTLRAYGAETLFVEAYAELGPSHADLPHYVADLASNYGYDAQHAIAVMGTYRNEFPSSYGGVEMCAGGGFGIYLLEPMTDLQLDAFAQLANETPIPGPSPSPNGGSATPATKPPTDVDCRATVRQAAKAWEAQQPSYQSRARLTVARRICDDTNTNDKWTTIRDQIVGLLDQQGIAK